MSSFLGKVVIITGASSGIGKACAEKFCSLGAKVVIAARNEANLKDVEQNLSSKGYEISYISIDVSVEENCKKLIEFTVNKYGTIDILINNAGISMRAVIEDVEISVIRKLMDVNFWGTVYCTKFALPYLLKQKGSVVGVSSIAGYKAIPGRVGYSASKYAIHGFLETLRVENLKNDLHVLIACPGYTATNIRNTALSKDGNEQGESPLDEDKLMKPEEVANYIVKAIKKRKRTLILTVLGKATVLVNKFFPAFVDNRSLQRLAEEPNSPFKV